MRGFTTAYIPGCDHAGISTQSVVENMLWRREKKTRHDLGRTAFVKRAYEWKDEYHKSINSGKLNERRQYVPMLINSSPEANGRQLRLVT